MSTDTVAVGGNSSSTEVESPSTLAYLAAENLPTVDQGNARPLDRVKGVCIEIATWFTKFAGLHKDSTGATVVHSLKSFSWVKTLKGFFPTKVTQLFAYEWVEGADGKKAPQGKPLAYRLWALYPAFNLESFEDTTVKTGKTSVTYAGINTFNSDGSLHFSVRPMANIVGLKRSTVKLFDAAKAIMTYKVPRLLHRNFILVDTAVEADGSIIVTRVLANYYMRLMFRNKTWQYEGRDAQLFAGCYSRKSIDCTDEFLAVLDTIEGKDIDSRVHATLKAFLGADPSLADKKLARIMAIQARALAGAHVDSLPGGEGSLKREHNLVDRVAMNTTTVRDCYFGVERTVEGKEAKDEFLDFTCRLMSIEDPIGQKAQGLAGTKRFNDGVHIVIDA